MLREEYIVCAAAVHIEGARTLRDSAASLLATGSLYDVRRALTLQCLFTDAQNLLGRAVSLGTGLRTVSGITKYTAACETRMYALGVAYDGSLTPKQAACEKARDVPPGTRADVYDGFTLLDAQAEKTVTVFLSVLDGILSEVSEGRACFGLPLGILRILRTLNADYSVACRKLAAGEQTFLARRDEAFSDLFERLRLWAGLQGADIKDATAQSLCSLSASGHIAGIPPVLFDMLLRYERYE